MSFGCTSARTMIFIKGTKIATDFLSNTLLTSGMDIVELVLLSRVLLVIFIYGLLSPLLLNALSTWGFTSVLLSLFPQLWHTAVLNRCGCSGYCVRAAAHCDIPAPHFFTPRR